MDMSRELQLSQSIQQTIVNINSKQRARSKSGGRSYRTVMQLQTQQNLSDEQEGPEKYNLSPDYQHVKAQYMDTSKAVNKLR
jgi:hypothetical protein